MLNIVDEEYSNTPFYTEIYTKEQFEELENLNLNPISVRIIHEKNTQFIDILKAKQIFQTDNYRITNKDVDNLKDKIKECYIQNIQVSLSVVYKKYQNKKNLQAVIFPIG